MTKTTKTTLLRDDTHKLLKDVQDTLSDRYGIGMSIQDIIARTMPNKEECIKKIIGSIRNLETNEITETKSS